MENRARGRTVCRQKTPLMLACIKGHVGVVRLLLQYARPRDLGVWDRDGYTPLHQAASRGHR